MDVFMVVKIELPPEDYWLLINVEEESMIYLYILLISFKNN